MRIESLSFFKFLPSYFHIIIINFSKRQVTIGPSDNINIIELFMEHIVVNYDSSDHDDFLINVSLPQQYFTYLLSKAVPPAYKINLNDPVEQIYFLYFNRKSQKTNFLQNC